MSKKPTKKPVPRAMTADEAAAAQRRIAELAEKIEAAKIAALDKIREIEAALQAETDPLSAEAGELAARLYDYAVGKKPLHGDSKTVHIGNAGAVEWALSPEAVDIDDEAAVIERLQALGLEKFIRHPPPEIDRDAMQRDKAEAEAIEGISFHQDEKVYVRPSGSRVRVDAKIGKRGKPGKWKLVWPKDEQDTE